MFGLIPRIESTWIKLLLIAALMGLLLFAPHPTAAQRLDCREWERIEREEGLFDFTVDAEWTATDENGETVEVRRYVNHTTGEWKIYRRSLGKTCRGDIDYDFGENECETITTRRSWTEEHSSDIEKADSGSYEMADPDTGETMTVQWRVVARYQDYVVIEFYVRNTKITCQHRTGSRASYSYIGFQGFPPGTRILAMDTNHSNDSTPYLCVIDESGNCWLQARKPNGEWVGNFWSPGRVTFAISGYGTITRNLGNGCTYYLINNGDGVNIKEVDFSTPNQSNDLGYVRYAGPPINLGGSPDSGSRMAQCSGGTVHVVAPGETLFRIALRYGTTVDVLVGINNLVDRNRISAGQQLTIACGQTAAPQSGQTTSAPSVSPPVTGSGTCGPETIHVVAHGETLFRIAPRYGTTIDAIVAANSIMNRNRIDAGQQLRIPCGG